MTGQAGELTDEVEITPEMIEAGMSAVDGYDLADGLISRAEEVCSIYRAMLAARQFPRLSAP